MSCTGHITLDIIESAGDITPFNTMASFCQQHLQIKTNYLICDSKAFQTMALEKLLDATEYQSL